MIAITRLDGSTLVVNADLVEAIEHTGDTVVTLVSGNRFVVRESVQEIIAAVVEFRARVLRSADTASMPVVTATERPSPPGDASEAKVIPLDSGRRNTE